MEIWKSIKGYENLYEVSNLGRVKSLERLDALGRPVKEKILKGNMSNTGYLMVKLSKGGVKPSKCIHVLVAMAFLDHVPDGHKLVINHKDFNKQNNNYYNLEIVTNRENSSHRKTKGSSKYTGVYWCNNTNKWKSFIRIKGKKKYLGQFVNEYDAHVFYQIALKEINENPSV